MKSPAPPKAAHRSSAATGQSARVQRAMLWPMLLLGALTLAVFADVLFSSGQRVLSARGADMASQFVYWRDFGFSHLRHGELPLWDPHIFAGAPFFGGFQSALLYPPNVIFLLLPLGIALNWSIALHVFLAGAFTFLWLRNHVQHTAAALLGAVMVMFGGPYFLHVFAGHLPNLCTMVWVPLVLLAVEKLVQRPGPRPCLLGIAAASMAILAGHPQYGFYTAIAAALYACALLARVQQRMKCIGLLVVVCIASAAITAVQLWTGLQESSESLRSVPLSYEFASIFAFAPENILTAIAPSFFGSLQAETYWGRCQLFEMSVFLSVTGLVLAAYGAVCGEKRTRWIAIGMVIVLGVLALGAHTPLFKLLYNDVPGFNKFRGLSKFAYLATLFVVLLASLGFDQLLHNRRTARWLVVTTFSLAIIAGAVGLCLKSRAADALWAKAVVAVFDTGETCDENVAPPQYHESGFIAQTRIQAGTSLLIAAATLLAVAALLAASNYSARWANGIVALAVVELFIFARGTVTTFDVSVMKPAIVDKVLRDQPGDYRISNSINPNAAMSVGGADIWGYDPGPTLRYAQFVAATAGLPADQATQNFPVRQDHPSLGLMRLRFVFATQNGQELVGEMKNNLPHLLLVGRARVMNGRDPILATVTDTNFNARDEVVLESAPKPAPEPLSGNSTVRLVDSSTDQLTIEATLDRPAVLLVTDAYSQFWKIRPLEAFAQREYYVLPADYCLRAVPLAAGHHLFKMEYRPSAFVIGKWVSLVSVLSYLACLGWCVVVSKRRT